MTYGSNTLIQLWESHQYPWSSFYFYKKSNVTLFIKSLGYEYEVES